MKETKGKILKGKVVSDKMIDTAVVSVVRYKKHKVYGKYMRVIKKYKVHNPDNKHKVGDEVSIVETKPISKTKSFMIKS